MSIRVDRQTVAVSTTSSVVQRIDCTDLDWVFVYLKNSGANALTAFSVARGMLDSAIADRFIVADSAADFADSTLIGCVTTAGATADPTVLSSGGVCALQIETYGCDYIELKATAGTATELTIAARGK